MLKRYQPLKRTPLKRKTPLKREGIKRTAKKYKKKNTGEREVFLQIWNERPHVCNNMNCKKHLGNEPRAQYFAHLKSKGAHPSLRLEKSNIVLLCFDCHREFDQGDKSKVILNENQD